MTTLLHIDASARDDTHEIVRHRSLSRQLSRRFVDTWLAHRPEDTVIRRDVGLNPPPFVSQAWIAAVFTPPEKRTAAQKALLEPSDTMIAELRAADVIVIGTPMYNYGVPAQLKAWVDQIIRINETFTFDLARGDFPLEPTMQGKTLVILSSAGEFGFEPGGVRASMNHLDTYLRSIAHYLGAAEIHHVAICYQEFGDERHERSKTDAFADAVRLAGTLAAARGDAADAGKMKAVA